MKRGSNWPPSNKRKKEKEKRKLPSKIPVLLGLSMHRTASNETVFISEIPYIIYENIYQNVKIAQRQGKKAISILSDEICEE